MNLCYLQHCLVAVLITVKTHQRLSSIYLDCSVDDWKLEKDFGDLLCQIIGNMPVPLVIVCSPVFLITGNVL